ERRLVVDDDDPPARLDHHGHGGCRDPGRGEEEGATRAGGSSVRAVQRGTQRADTTRRLIRRRGTGDRTDARVRRVGGPLAARKAPRDLSQRPAQGGGFEAEDGAAAAGLPLTGFETRAMRPAARDGRRRWCRGEGEKSPSLYSPARSTSTRACHYD